MRQLHIVLIPAMAHGHMIPTLDMAKLFTSRGLKTTIISTPSFAPSIENARESGHDIGLIILPFPPKNSSLPDHILSLDQAKTPETLASFVEAMSLIQAPVEKLLLELNPDCLVTDTFLPWTVDSADNLGIPRLAFHGTSFFAMCLSEQMHLHKPYKNARSDNDPFALLGLPHELTFRRTQVPPNRGDDGFPKLFREIRESEGRSYGVIVNSFYELEPDYANHFKNVLMRKNAYHVGPLFLWSAMDGEKRSNIEHECLAWLDSKRAGSVVYVCFGSMASFSRAQLQETAAGLEGSGQDFLWAVGKNAHIDEESYNKGRRGLIVRGWAPQRAILGHRAVGAFVTHCGWNSTIEGICAGVPMVTWPIFAEQFYNEKMVTDVLGIGVAVGNVRWMKDESEGVGRGAVEAAVRRVTVGEGAEGAEGMRVRARRYKEMAREAVGDGGSSRRGLDGLIGDLRAYVRPVQNSRL